MKAERSPAGPASLWPCLVLPFPAQLWQESRGAQKTKQEMAIRMLTSAAPRRDSARQALLSPPPNIHMVL